MWRTFDNFLNSYGGIVVLVIGILILIALLAPYFMLLKLRELEKITHELKMLNWHLGNLEMKAPKVETSAPKDELTLPPLKAARIKDTMKTVF